MSKIYPDSQDILFQLSKKTAINYKNFRKEFPNLKNNDIRVTTYGACANTVENILFSCIFQKEQLKDPNWYKKVPYLKDMTYSQIVPVQHVYESFLRVAFVTEYFSIFEHFFRVLLKKINPNSKVNKIYKIIETILQEFNLKDYQRIFDLYRFIRNLLHSGGRITDENTYPILYKGILYELKQNEFVNVDWVMLSNLSWDMQECVDKIVRSQQISQLSEILDPSIPSDEFGYNVHDVNQFL